MLADRLQARVEAREAAHAAAFPSLPPLAAPGAVPLPANDLVDRFERRKDLAVEMQKDPEFSDVARICELPIIPPLTSEEHEAYCQANVLADQMAKGWRLWPVQSQAVLSYEIYDGLFAPIGVGWGKTLISLMIAEKAFRRGHKKTLLLVPASVYPQLVNSNIPWARTKVPISVPFHYLGGKTLGQRRMITRSKRVGCYILPYSLLSTTDARTVDNETGTIEGINPSVVIGDEIHYLANRGAGRTKNLINWMIEQQPRLACMSGTITYKSVKDYHHLVKLSLGKNSPLPLSPQLAGEWGQVLDADSYFSAGQAGPIKPLVDWARTYFPTEDFAFDKSGFRKAYRLRLTTTPGVVSTGDTDISTSLTITNRPVLNPEKSDGWARLQKHTDDVLGLFITPNGDEIEHAILQHKWLRELTAGFYNEYIWPTIAKISDHDGVGLEEAADRLNRSLEHHKIHQVYSKLLREWLKDHDTPGLATPMQVGNSMTQHGTRDVGPELYYSWRAVKDAEFEGMPVRYSRAVRVCDYKIVPAISWAKSLPLGEGALIWYKHQEVGRWLFEYAKAASLEVLHCPAGTAASRALDFDLNPQNASKILICSIDAHNEGKNMQPMGHSYFVEWAQSARKSEQVLGRNHRSGQMRDELAPVTCRTTEFDDMSFASTLNDALYIHQTMGNRQKLIYCGYDPMPPIFPPEVLTERGFQSKLLSTEQRVLLEETFGAYKP